MTDTIYLGRHDTPSSRDNASEGPCQSRFTRHALPRGSVISRIKDLIMSSTRGEVELNYRLPGERDPFNLESRSPPR